MSNKLQIKLMVDMGPPQEKYPVEAEDQKTVEEEVRECIECIESGFDSHVEWKTLNGLYRELRKLPKSPRVTNLIDMIEPVMSKYGQHGVAEKDK